MKEIKPVTHGNKKSDDYKVNMGKLLKNLIGSGPSLGEAAQR